jgi:hypothetical protein
VRFSRTGLFRKYSLPQVGLGLEGCLPRLGSSYDPWSCNFEALQYCFVALPRITVALATPVEPLQQNPHGTVEELFQTGGVPVDSVVIVVPTKFGVQPLEEFWQSEVSVLLAPRGEALQGTAEFLAGRPPLEVIFPLAIFAPSKLEPQKLKAGFPCLSVPTERDEPCLGSRQLQSEFLQPLP